MTLVIKEIEVRDIITKTNLPVSDYAVNPYVGCTHACKYCYSVDMIFLAGYMRMLHTSILE